MRALAAIAIAGCSSASPVVDSVNHTRSAAIDVGVCVERELTCEQRHVELVDGKPITVLGGGVDCVGPRRVECTWPGGRHEAIAGEASDVEGLGGGRYRYLTWHDRQPMLVTVEGTSRRGQPGGAPRTYGPFGDYGLTAQSLDGRLAVEPIAHAGALTGVAIRDTILGTSVTAIAFGDRIDLARDAPQILARRDASAVAVCTRTGSALVVRFADRNLALPGTRCVAVDSELSRVLVRVGSSLEVVDLSDGAATPVDGAIGAFVGRDAVLVVRHGTELALVALPDRGITPLGNVPFAVDELHVAPDQRSAVAFAASPGEHARAFVVGLPDGPGHEIEIPADSVAITLVPGASS